MSDWTDTLTELADKCDRFAVHETAAAVATYCSDRDRHESVRNALNWRTIAKEMRELANG